MPTYDYQCKECGHRFETFQSMKDAVLTTCPQCEAESLQRLIGAGAGLLFKGSGYYLTDYKKSSSSAATADTGGAGNGDTGAGSASASNSSESASSNGGSSSATPTPASKSTSAS